jgi:hypothetical protein
MRLGFAVVSVAALLAGCAHESANPGVRQHIDQLTKFDVTAALHQDGCGAMSSSSDSVAVDASNSYLPPRLQAATPIAGTDLHLRVVFGSGLPGSDCTDLPDEVSRPLIEETWPAEAASAVFSVVASERCSSATLKLADVTVIAPTGERVSLGDITMSNNAWQAWPPFECHIQSDTSTTTTN